MMVFKIDAIAALALTIFVLGISITKCEYCVPRDFGYGSIVCVCNSTYCDSKPRNVPGRGNYEIYESSKSGKRLNSFNGSFENSTSLENEVETIKIYINPDEQFQTIHGFGGAFTDAAGINIKNLSEGCQNQIIETYFGPDGSRYNLGRVPIGGTDFSTRAYTLDDTPNDVSLQRFSLSPEDNTYRIPLMQKALQTNPDLRFVSAAWSAPPWMKTNDNYEGFGFLKNEYYQTYANYLLKFLLEYKQHGLPIWAISTGNEPLDAFVPFWKFNSMGWTGASLGRWVADNLGPTIASSESNYTLILVLDDQRLELPWCIIDIFRNKVAENYTAGIAVHWYFDGIVPPNVLDETNVLYPQKFILMTESCVGNLLWDYPKVRLGDWNRAEHYIMDIIENFNHWVTGWIDWNLALDRQGGPNWARNYVDSAIIVNPETDEFFKQPYYYVLAHFSKFITLGSRRIGTTTSEFIPNVAFRTPDNETVLVVYNRNSEPKTIVITDPQQGKIVSEISGFTLQTIIYKN